MIDAVFKQVHSQLKKGEGKVQLEQEKEDDGKPALKISKVLIF